jgi:phage FluMu protein Com
MDKEWRCTRCGKLLGLLRDGRLHLRFARGHEYLVGFPATSVCRGCRTLNELSEAKPAESVAPADKAVATR